LARITVGELKAQIDKLLAEIDEMKGRARHDDQSDLQEESAAIVVRLRAALERLSPGPSTYLKEMNAIADDCHNSTAGKIRAYVGILHALRADASEGWFDGVAELLHADTFSDFLDQATELVDKGYKDAAAVIAGSALEAHIRLLCTEYGTSAQLPSGQPKKADVMNSDLVKAGAYNNLQQKAVTGWLAIRNAAAHGDYAKYTKEQAVAMIISLRDFIIKYPA
jgi:hypothetical protein